MSYAGVAANVIGGELQGWASVLDKQAMADQYRAQAGLQKGFADQATGLIHPQQFGAEAMIQGVGQGAQNRLAGYQNLANIPLSTNMPGGATAASDQAWANLVGGARANLGGYSDWAVQQAINNIRTQQQLSQITDQARGQAQNVFPQQMYKAQHSMDDLAMIGQAISSIGGGSSNYAQFAQGPQQTPGGGAPTYYPMGTSYPGYQQFQGYGDPYGNYYPQGWNTISNTGGNFIPG